MLLFLQIVIIFALVIASIGAYSNHINSQRYKLKKILGNKLYNQIKESDEKEVLLWENLIELCFKNKIDKIDLIPADFYRGNRLVFENGNIFYQCEKFTSVKDGKDYYYVLTRGLVHDSLKGNWESIKQPFTYELDVRNSKLKQTHFNAIINKLYENKVVSFIEKEYF